MEKEIRNRVAESKLITFDLEDFYPEGKRVQLDIKDWLYEKLILREKDFRNYVETHDWSMYRDCWVALHCSSDAIIPGWAYMLIASKTIAWAKKTVIGNLEDLETAIYQDILNDLDVSYLVDRPVIIKGCSHKPVPENAYLMAIEKIQPVAKSILYGEACSSVPLYKKK